MTSLGRLPADRVGAAGLAATALSVAATFTVGVLGPSVMEPALPGRPGQPPWAATVQPSAYLVVALTGFAILAGTAGLALTLRAFRRGWTISPQVILAAGILAAVALALVPPFGSSDHLSYAAYGRMVVTGHNPFTTTPADLARLGDPVARAVQDWRSSPSVYGSLATGGQALASLIGGTSVRLTVFVLSLLDVAAFAVTGLLLHWLARGDRRRQLRVALLWAANPLLLQVLIAGAHVDTQAIVFAVGAVAVFALGLRPGPARFSQASHASPGGQLTSGGQAASADAGAGPAATPGAPLPATDLNSAAATDPNSGAPLPAAAGLSARRAVAAAGAGALIGLGFAVKETMALIGAGLAIGCVLAWRAQRRPAAGGRRELVQQLAALAAGFCVAAGASLAYWGIGALQPALREGSFVSIGSPWRAVRSLVRLATGEGAAEDLVKSLAVVLAVVLLVLLLSSVSRALPGSWPPPGRLGGSAGAGRAGPAQVVVAASFAVAFAWLVAWPYVLPWYDGLGWAFLALLPASRLDWLMLARTAGLAIGYLPGRTVAMPASLGWLETVVRTGITPAILLAVTVALVLMLRPRRDGRPPPAPAPGSAADRNVADGRVAPGNVTPGSDASGSVAPGPDASGSAADGNDAAAGHRRERLA
jgi:hypothetical protein